MWLGCGCVLRLKVQRQAKHAGMGRLKKCGVCCCCALRQVWYDYARWQADSGGGVAQATACLQRAVHALPNCLLLFFALADLHEAQGDIAAAKQVRLLSLVVMLCSACVLGMSCRGGGRGGHAGGHT